VSRANLARLALILVIAAGFATAATHWNEINVETLEIRIREFGIWAPLLFIAAYCVAAIFFLPATLFTLAAGVLFGPLWGAVYSLAGASLGAALAFFVARYIAANWISGHAGPRVSRIIDGVAEEGWRFVAVTRLIPIFPYAPLNYFFGVSRVPFLHFLLATIIFMAPSALAYSWLGHIGMEAAAGRGNWVKFALLGLAALALIIFLPRVIKYIRK